jgi:hypothetical protein
MRRRSAVENERLRRWLLARRILEPGQELEPVDLGQPEMVAEVTAAIEGCAERYRRATKVIIRQRPQKA